MGSYERIKRKRARLFEEQGGRCYWCRQPMKLLQPYLTRVHGRRPPADMCTIEHLDSRWHPDRGRFGGHQRIVAACLRCNNARDVELLKALPRSFLDEAAAGTPARELRRKYEWQLRAIHAALHAKWRRASA